MARHQRQIRWILIVSVFSLLATACISSLGVNTTDAPPTPLPTQEPVLIPTTAPSLETPTAPPGDAELANSPDEDTATETPDVTPTAAPTPTVTPFPTATADVIQLETPVPVPTVARPTSTPVPRSPQPQPQPQPVQQPVPQAVQQQQPPVRQAPSSCPGGQVATNGGCSCPGGTAKRATDNQCVRLCGQSELTITFACVCTGEFYDNGGQCVKRCLTTEIPDGQGGCKLPSSDGT